MPTRFKLVNVHWAHWRLNCPGPNHFKPENYSANLILVHIWPGLSSCDSNVHLIPMCIQTCYGFVAASKEGDFGCENLLVVDNAAKAVCKRTTKKWDVCKHSPTCTWWRCQTFPCVTDDSYIWAIIQPFQHKQWLRAFSRFTSIQLHE